MRFLISGESKDIEYKRYRHEMIHMVLVEVYVLRSISIIVQYDIKTMERIEALYKSISYVHDYDIPYVP
jgi:hypothetical protein